MRVTKFTDYALRVLIYLACKPSGELTTISQLAEAYSISVHHVRVVVHKLGQAGYINSTPGKGGGIELAQRPDEILIGEVIRSTEKDFFIVECFNPEGKCAIARACRLKHILGDALNAFIDTLDQYTLADITDNRHAIIQQIKVA